MVITSEPTIIDKFSSSNPNANPVPIHAHRRHPLAVTLRKASSGSIAPEKCDGSVKGKTGLLVAVVLEG